MIGGAEALERLRAAGLLERDLPCCTFTACWLLEVAEMQPRVRTVAGYARASRAVAADWWRLANVVDEPGPGEPDAWGLERAAEALGVAVRAQRSTVSAVVPPPPLRRGAWHVVQRWTVDSLVGDRLRWEGDEPTAALRGHAYLVWAPDPPHRVLVAQSSASDGYRESTGGWHGSAGLEGYRVSVTTLGVAP